MGFMARGVSRQNMHVPRASFSMAFNPQSVATEAIKANKVMIFSKTRCPYCKKAKEALTDLKIDFVTIELGKRSFDKEQTELLHSKVNRH